MNVKHELKKVEINVFCLATVKYLSDDRDSYKKEIEREMDVVESVCEMNLDSSKEYDYVGKFLPTKIILRTRVPAKLLETKSGIKSTLEFPREKFQKFKKFSFI